MARRIVEDSDRVDHLLRRNEDICDKRTRESCDHDHVIILARNQRLTYGPEIFGQTMSDEDASKIDHFAWS